jgi:hypothetical protein
MPGDVAGAAAVARGWRQQLERASRLDLPDTALVERVISARADVALAGPVDDADDAAGALIGVGELVRLGAAPEPWVTDVVTMAERLGRSARTCGLAWDGAMGLAATERVLAAAHESRAAADVAAMRERLGGGGAPAPRAPPDGIRLVPGVVKPLAPSRADGCCVLLPEGHPWVGANWSAHHLPAGPRSRVSFAVRWHGERPALLWETEGDPLPLAGGAAAPAWHSADVRGDALWPAP